MTGRVLVVDDVLANVKLLQARLAAEYFEVLIARSGEEALKVLQSECADVVLLDVMMPGMDGFELCRRIKTATRTMHVPVVMVTALDQTCDRVQGLEAGADDFITKPVDAIALITRVKNLARLKTLNDEMMLRMATARQNGVLPSAALAWPKAESGGRILLVEDGKRTVRQVLAALGQLHEVQVEANVPAALARIADKPCDLMIISLNLAAADGLRLCSQVRALERTRHLPVIVIVQPGEDARLLRALDMGVDDYLTRPVDRNELLARVRTQMKRKGQFDYWRGRLEESVELTVTDALTGLYNRRSMQTRCAVLAEQAQTTGQPLSLVLVDIDNFNSINAAYGHNAGDSILRGFATRLRDHARSIDLVCRISGEQFVIIMPNSSLEAACQTAERLRACIAAEPFQATGETTLKVTASVGVAALDEAHAALEGLFKRADRALYVAKQGGRNKVVADAA
jgi:two-component system, cell cycle response regulator